MSDARQRFVADLRARLDAQPDRSRPEVARKAHMSRAHLHRIENGERWPSQGVVTALDDALGAGGELRTLWRDAGQHEAQGEKFIALPPSMPHSSPPLTVLQALETVASSKDGDTFNVTIDCMDELVRYYSGKLSMASPVELYEDLLRVRRFADSLLNQSSSSTRRRTDLIAIIGWLSNLLAVCTSYMGDHGSSLIWCRDAERHSHNSGSSEIAAWAAFNRAVMAYYHGQDSRSIELASGGQAITAVGTVAYAKLAAQEMRAQARTGDSRRTLEAGQRAKIAIAALPSSGVATTGVFSIALADDPPYTATSLLSLGEFEKAASATQNVIASAYGSDTLNPDRKSSSYSRTLLVLALCRVGIGDVDGALVAGREALSGDLVWPTLVLARKLDRSLMSVHQSTAEVKDYHELLQSSASSILARGDE